MTRTNPPRNLAGSAGRWSAHHWKTATFAWIAFVIAAVIAGGAAGTRQLNDPDSMNGDSADAQRIIDAAHFPAGGTEAILVQSPSISVTHATFRQAVRDIVADVKALRVVDSVQSPYAAKHDDLLAADRHSAVIAVNLAGRT